MAIEKKSTLIALALVIFANWNSDVQSGAKIGIDMTVGKVS